MHTKDLSEVYVLLQMTAKNVPDIQIIRQGWGPKLDSHTVA